MLAPVADAAPLGGRAYDPSRHRDRDVDWGTWFGRLGRALSIRVVFFSLVFGVCVQVLVSLVWHGVGFWVVWVAAGLAYLVAVLNDQQMMRCDRCGKAVKLGYDRCHHCGYSRVGA